MYNRLIAIFLILSAFLMGTPFASAASLEDATVNVYCRLKLSGRTYASTGSGVFIDERGVILTNAHVGQRFLLATSSKAKTDCTVRTGSPAKETYTASLLYLPSAWYPAYTAAVNEKTENVGTGRYDFALLYVTGTTKKKAKLPATFPALSLASTTSISLLTENAPVQIAGYPAENLDYKGLRDKLKLLTASSIITDFRFLERPYRDILVIGPSLAGKSGVSGGPVTGNDDVIGIVTTVGDSKEKNMRSIRALSVAHIERITLAETLAPLSTMIAGDYVARATLTQNLVPKDFRTKLEATLRRVR